MKISADDVEIWDERGDARIGIVAPARSEIEEEVAQEPQHLERMDYQFLLL